MTKQSETEQRNTSTPRRGSETSDYVFLREHGNGRVSIRIESSNGTVPSRRGDFVIQPDGSFLFSPQPETCQETA